MHLPEATQVRKATARDLDAIVEILGDAFLEDPVMRWVTPRTSYPGYVFALTLPFCLEHDNTYIATDGSGAASWLPPGVRLQSPVGPGVLWNGLRDYGPRALVRALATLVQSQSRHPKDDDYYYLFTIGALRSQRGRGVGSALMREGLGKCDEDHMPAYLESSNAKNLPFYRKHGFEVIDELRLAMNGPTLWLMRRDAR
jgi:ribosomal protein S18 acetylase RimI-like enzyme